MSPASFSHSLFYSLGKNTLLQTGRTPQVMLGKKQCLILVLLPACQILAQLLFDAGSADTTALGFRNHRMAGIGRDTKDHLILSSLP